jgi:polyferredoxin
MPRLTSTQRSSSRWVAARKLTQAAALLLFIALFIAARRGGWPPALVNLPLRLDPLLMLAHLLASKTFLAGSAVALLILLLTLVFGRAWCGWLCPLGVILDILTPRRKPARPMPAALRSLKYGLLLVILAAALLGNLTLLLLDPLTLLFRTLTVSLWPALDWAVTWLEGTLYRLPGLGEPVAAFDAWARPLLLPPAPVHYRPALAFAALFVIVIALNWLAPRFWCRYLCPLGGLLGLLSKLALFRRQVGAECRGCQLCTAACPTGTIDPTRAYASDPSECTLCLDCLPACPRSDITFTPRLQPAAWQPYDPNRRQALVALGLGLGGAALLGAEGLVLRPSPGRLRPPGAQADDFASQCVRCGACLRACPTAALQPALSEAGIAGFWSPIIIPRLGYCDYACNACGQICPVQAIPPLDLETKRRQVIGRAQIDQQRCLPWAEGVDCIVCEEMCPLPEKAIRLKAAAVFNPSAGALVTVKQPHVDHERCIGCGICEYKCPVSGAAAIQVYAHQTHRAA